MSLVLYIILLYLHLYYILFSCFMVTLKIKVQFILVVSKINCTFILRVTIMLQDYFTISRNKILKRRF